MMIQLSGCKQLVWNNLNFEMICSGHIFSGHEDDDVDDKSFQMLTLHIHNVIDDYDDYDKRLCVLFHDKSFSDADSSQCG